MNKASPRLGTSTSVIMVLVALLCACGSVGAAVWVYDQLQERAVEPPPSSVVNVAEQGLLVTAVTVDSAAAQAGLRRGDIILEVGDTAVNTPRDLQQLVRASDVGAILTLTVQRGDDMLSLSVTLAETRPRLGVSVLGPGATGATPGPGMTMEGVLVARVLPNTPATVAGLQAGDRIMAVNAQPVAEGAALETAVTDRQPGDTLRLTWQRDGQSFSADITLASHPDDPERPYLGIELTPEPTP